MVDSFKETILTANKFTKEAILEMNESNTDKSRDSSLKAMAILELACSFNYYNTELNICKGLLEKLISKMKCAAPYFIKDKKVVIESNEQQNNIIDADVTNRIVKVKFSDIIGCDDAKQSLFENIVLPLTMNKSHRSILFAGIRGGTGNVLLHGPPGTGKTLLAQV
jgi:ATP-dependent Zn protease